VKPIRNAILLLASTLSFSSLQGQTSTASPVVTLKRTHCFGTCPIYELSVFADGTVQWSGEQYVGTVGKASATLSKQQVDDLIQTLAASRFSTFQNSYKSQVTDLPTTFLTFTYDGVTKTVEDYAFGPDELHHLELLVEQIGNSHRWLHDEDNVLTLESIEPSYRFTTAEDLKNELIVTADIYRQTKPGFTPLMQAAGQGAVQTIAHEIKSGVDVNRKDETGWTALMMAAVAGQPETLALLLKNGAQVRPSDKNGDTALIGAAANPYLYWKPQVQAQVVQQLLAAGADINQANQLGESALMWAAKSGSPEVVQLLLKAGADSKKRDRLGHDPAYHVQQWLSMRIDDIRRSRYQQSLTLLQSATR
jgi:hypothetical protein